MDLRLCPIGSAVEVSWLDLDEDERARLRELGIREGTVLHVVNCGAFGSKVVAVGSDRFAIDGRTCACIAVIPQDGEHAVVGSRNLAGLVESAARTAPSAAPVEHAESPSDPRSGNAPRAWWRSSRARI